MIPTDPTKSAAERLPHELWLFNHDNEQYPHVEVFASEANLMMRADRERREGRAGCPISLWRLDVPDMTLTELKLVVVDPHLEEVTDDPA